MYPTVKHKLPELFNAIIKSDHLLSLHRQLKVVDFQKFKKNREERRNFTRAAELYVQRQKGST